MQRAKRNGSIGDNVILASSPARWTSAERRELACATCAVMLVEMIYSCCQKAKGLQGSHQNSAGSQACLLCLALSTAGSSYAASAMTTAMCITGHDIAVCPFLLKISASTLLCPCNVLKALCKSSLTHHPYTSHSPQFLSAAARWSHANSIWSCLLHQQCIPLCSTQGCTLTPADSQHMTFEPLATQADIQ